MLALVLFWLLAEPCDGVARLICGAGTECLWGDTIGEYWAKYGTGGSIAAAVLGYVLAAD